MNFEHEVIFCIVNAGFADAVMDAAKEYGARGGTVIHAKGTGMEHAQQFLGFSLASEKEAVLMVVPTAKKNDIMKAVMEQAGLTTKAKAIAFSLPVTDTAGMRLMEEPAE